MSKMPSEVLVVAAWEPELLRFRELATPGIRMSAVGIGLVDAAIGMARALAGRTPRLVVLVGTCGSARADLAVGSVVTARSVQLVDAATLEGRAALPFGSDPLLAEPSFLAEAQPVRIANPLGVTTDDALASLIAAAGEVEHLETYAVARACTLAGVPWAAVLGIANRVGSAGRDEWRAHHVGVSARAAEVASGGVEAWLKRSTTAPSPA